MGASRLFVKGCPKCALTFRAGQKNTQCHGMVTLARWVPLIIYQVYLKVHGEVKARLNVKHKKKMTKKVILLLSNDVIG